ncbi:hypothetical protein [Streptomyces noursei]|uniref:hypothetical protein n=1 Tax=Streptomyces noursei TaxID=1971 RepID=UPI0016786B18|nr:hypothetical protein [Streptomyces noursei]MCZ1021053.1 hypothetical protein [Streptomyces noursei]
MSPQRRLRLREAPLARTGAELGEVLDFVREEIAPFPTGNGHPAFFAWVNSPPAPAGINAELLASAINATCGMGENALRRRALSRVPSLTSSAFEERSP